MRRFIEFYKEAIELDVAKEKKMSRKYSGAYREDTINAVFGDKDRLIYNYDVDYKEDFKNTMKNPDSAYSGIVNFLEFMGYSRPSMQDYIEGKITDGKQQLKIGRILNKNVGKQPTLMTASDEMVPKFSHLFKVDPVRHIKNPDLAVVVSRHPYDIYGMSTGRMWTSCMDLNKPGSDGNNCKYIPAEIEHGTLIAYLIPRSEVKENGKAALKKPISRILLKPMRNEDYELGYAISQTYGGSMNGFEEFVEKWADSNFNSKLNDREGFTLDPNVYEDPYTSKSLGLADENVEVKREIENELRKLKAEFISHLPPHLKPLTIVNNFVNVDGDIEAQSSVAIMFKDPEFIESLNFPNPIRIPKDDINEHPQLMKRYNVHYNMPHIEHYRAVSINPRLGIVKFMFSAKSDNGSLAPFRKMFMDILRIPTQTLKVV